MGNRQGGFLHPSLCRLQQRKPGSPSQGSWRGAPERPIKQQSRRPVEDLRLCCYGKEVKVSVKCRFKSEVDLSVVVAALEQLLHLLLAGLAEWKILPHAIDLIANGKVTVKDGRVSIAR